MSLYCNCTVLYYCTDLLHGASQLVHVLQHALGQAAVRVSVDKQLHVEQITDLNIIMISLTLDQVTLIVHAYFGIVEGENALEEHHVDLAGVDCDVLVPDTRVQLEVVHGNVGHVALDDVHQTLLHQFVVKCIYKEKEVYSKCFGYI